MNIVRNTNCEKYIFLTRPLDQDVKNVVNIKNYKEVQTINNLKNCELVNLQYCVDNSLLTELRNNQFGKTLKKVRMSECTSRVYNEPDNIGQTHYKLTTTNV